jgi:type IV pilus assembly protein PilC
MLFTYKAVKDGGEVVTGEKSAEDERALYEALKNEGLTLVTAESKVGRFTGFAAALEEKTSRIKEADKIMFARNLGAMIEAGLPTSRALGVLSRQSKNKKLKKVIADLDETISTGQSLSVGLDKFPTIFPPIFTAMVRAGEESGNLVGALKVTAGQMERSYKLKRKIRGAMMYPGIIISAMILIGVLMMIFVVPTLTATFKELNADLPKSTQLIIFISDFLKEHFIIAFGIIAIIITLFITALRTARGQRIFEAFILKLPMVGFLVQEINSARTADTLSSLLQSGVEVTRSIEITRDVVQNSHYREVLDKVKEAIQGGAPMSGVFREYEHLYPPLVGEMVAVGEETGKLSELLERVAGFYQEDVDQKTKDMSTIIEPFLMVLIGGVVGFFAISMISPMYSLSNSI